MVIRLLPICILMFILVSLPLSIYSQSPADSGYYYLNKGKTKKAAEFFELHLKQKPDDYKTRLQLGYIYYDRRNLNGSLKQFEYVGKHSPNEQDKEISKSAAYVIRDERTFSAPRSFDLYFYGFYDSYQDNYIFNVVSHFNFKMAEGFFGGPYIDLYTDTRSTPQVIYNDRFFELGGFMRYSILKNLLAEFRIGYVRQVDRDTSRINLKGLLVYFNRLGDAKVFVSSKSKTSKISLYMDLYSCASYDYKYDNGFLQIALQEVLRFHTGGYSYLEGYLMQNVQFDSRRLEYNNYAEVGGGIRFHPNIMYFPIFFIEPTYKFYHFGNLKNSFQVKAGMLFNYRTVI